MKVAWSMLVVLVMGVGCASTNGSRTAEAGPYRIQYSGDGSGENLTITRGGQPVYSTQGNTITVFSRGRAFLSYAASPDNTVSAYMIHVRNKDGQDAFTLVDENVDGSFERKIDYGTKQVYEWRNGQWVMPARKSGAPAAAP